MQKRNSVPTGLACTSELLPVLLASALAAIPEHERPQGLQVWRTDPETKLPELPLEIEPRPCQGIWPVLVAGLADDAGPDLLVAGGRCPTGVGRPGAHQSGSGGAPA